MTRPKARWSICYRDGQWRVYDRDCWYISFDDLPEAHTWATQQAVADVLCEPGGLNILRYLLDLERAARRPGFWRPAT